MNRLNSHTSDQNTVDLERQPALSCTATETVTDEPATTGLVEALLQCESCKVAVYSWGISVGSAVVLLLLLLSGLLSLVLFGVPGALTSAMILGGFGAILLAIHNPWRDRRRRRRECRELLEQLAAADSLEGPKRQTALENLRLLSYPTSGESPETRRMARDLHQRHSGGERGSLPIAAASPSPSANSLPVAAAESSDLREP